MTLQGKGFFIWKIADCEHGNPEAIATAAKNAGMTHVLIKIADGAYAYNLDPQTKFDRVGPVVEALRHKGMQVWGWHYVYGYDPAGEARIAVRRVQQFQLDGYVIDAEEEYKEPGRASAAQRFCKELRKGIPNVPVALSSYRFPTYHPQFPWRAFLEFCDYNMPQVYWEKAHNPAAQMARVMKEFHALSPTRPVIPTGPAYKWNGWRPTEADLTEFLGTAATYQIPAMNFFSWDECRRDLPNLWNLIAQYPFGSPPVPQPEPPKDIPEQYIDTLNSRKPEAVASLYHPQAVHITAARTIQGGSAIRSWYDQFLTEALPGAAFTLTGITGSTSISRHFTWQAASTCGATQSGSDTFGLMDGKIIYHYTSFKNA